MHVRKSFVMVVALCSLFHVGSSAASEEARGPGNLHAEMALGADRIDWQPIGDYDEVLLTIAGPEEFRLSKEFPDGQPTSLSLFDQDGKRLPDGTYLYELRLMGRKSGPLSEQPLLQAGSFVVRNPFLEKMLEQKGRNDEDTWTSITTSQGSVQHLDCLDDHEKAVFKTAFEIDQRWLVEHGADRAPFICQSQSLNIFLPADVHKRDLHQIHMMAWKRGVKSLYYCRSLSIQRAENVAGEALTAAPLGDQALSAPRVDAPSPVPLVPPAAPQQSTDYEECLSCQ